MLLTNANRSCADENEFQTEPVNQEGRFGGGRIASLAGKGRPVPLPPQLLQPMRPEPAHVRQPTSPSDQREQRQGTRPVPLQLGHRGNGPAMGLWSITDLTRTAPASTLRPVVSTIGPILALLEVTNGDELKIEKGGREREEEKG